MLPWRSDFSAPITLAPDIVSTSVVFLRSFFLQKGGSYGTVPLGYIDLSSWEMLIMLDEYDINISIVTGIEVKLCTV
ncbi:MAG: hypothetical protein AMR96_00070 [Candidatus Adiutrix intracellularis]|jgi:hypothetical protein|nr:MAG: hypothetical protein AMR96_00070 [Candidatus Adiutrix intracellularis]